jgi:intracellular sulfur oxidation DsrE/DsrF family protein
VAIGLLIGVEVSYKSLQPQTDVFKTYKQPITNSFNFNIFTKTLFTVKSTTKTNLLLLLFLTFIASNAIGQGKSTGPIIEKYGGVFQIPDATYKTDINHEFKVVYDIMSGATEGNQLNPYMESVARFLNMHAQSGVSPGQLNAVMVVHNNASKDLLNNESYNERYGMDNPNIGLLEALIDSGVEVILCGQSSLSRDIPIEQTVKGTKLALSAMTALIQYQDAGYRLIKY